MTTRKTTDSKQKRLPAKNTHKALTTWIEPEAEAASFGDERLGRRFRRLLGEMHGCVGGSIPYACQDWAAVKAAYRFLSNPRVGEGGIFAGHFEAVRTRVHAAPGTVLILHDTTEFVFQRESATEFGLLSHPCMDSGRRRGHQRRHLTVRGLLMHSSMALTLDGVPLGLAAVKFWSRKQFKGCNALKRKINPTRIPIEEKESYRWLENIRQAGKLLEMPERCVHIGDRESDIYELFCVAAQESTHFLVRTCVDRLVDDKAMTVAKAMERPDGKGRHRMQLQTMDGKASLVLLDISYRRLRLLPPIGKQKQWPGLELTVIHAIERGKPAGREPICWKLLTDLPVHSVKQAVEKLDWYALRWKIEVFHKILKSGCRAEDSQLRTSERLVKLVALFCIVSWRIFWMTMISRACPDGSVSMALTDEERRTLDHTVPPKPSGCPRHDNLQAYITAIARLGGYLARNRDHPPGNMVIWRGLRRLADIMIGAKLMKTYG